MSNISGLLNRFSAANGDEMVEILSRPSLADEEILGANLGSECYSRLHNLAIRYRLIHDELGVDRDDFREHVLVIPGMLGTELISVATDGQQERVWLDAQAIVQGKLQRLRLDPSGLDEADTRYRIETGGVLKRYYGELMLTLAHTFHVAAFPYDWRKSLDTAATELFAYLKRHYQPDDTVHLVAVGEGGIVARLCIARHLKTINGRLLLLGSPIHGSFAFVQALAGHNALVAWADKLDTHHGPLDYLSLVRSMPSLYELLPSPTLVPDNSDPSWKKLYIPQTYRDSPGINVAYLKRAQEMHEFLENPPAATIGIDNTICIVGENQPTVVKADVNVLNQDMPNPKAYELGSGDGRTACNLADFSKSGAQTFYADVRKERLLAAPTILHVLADLLNAKDKNERSIIANQAGLTVEPTEWASDSHWTPLDRQNEFKDAFQHVSRHLRPISDHAEVVGSRAMLAEKERTIEDALARLYALDGLSGSSLTPSKIPQVRVGVKLGDIATLKLDLFSVEQNFVDELDQGSLVSDALRNKFQENGITLSPEAKVTVDRVRSEWTMVDAAQKYHIKVCDKVLNVYEELTFDPVPLPDAIVVGNYLGEEPKGAFLQLEKALYGASDPVFGELIQRHVIRSYLGALFLVPDQRALGRTIIIAGQGVPGRFGLPELKILARELCWTLHRLGKRHLVTVLLGDGRGGGLGSIDEVMSAWMHGIQAAITGIDIGAGLALTVTFIQHKAQKALEMDQALQSLKIELAKSMTIDYSAFTDTELCKLEFIANRQLREQHNDIQHQQKEALHKQIVQRQAHQGNGSVNAGEVLVAPAQDPIHIHIERNGSTFRFSALTPNAAIAERDIAVPIETIIQANADLKASDSDAKRVLNGDILARLLLPDDLLDQMSGNAPLVVSVDAAAARIYWELLRLPSDLAYDFTEKLDNELFLGVGRGLTRQLRTVLAPHPEVLPSKKCLLRVLVVADAAADAPLYSAQEEGVAVANLFEMSNRLQQSGNRVEVMPLIGPGEATHAKVLGELLTRNYDVLHFAGHCCYVAENSTASGWVFSNGQLLTAQEIQRTGRMPGFIFSNACDSGVTPDRADPQLSDLAPNFAESFFAKGVANFVCTGWSVDDRAARDFALALYANLLGFKLKADNDATSGKSVVRVSSLDPHCYESITPNPMYIAMREARKKIVDSDNGRSWGAYQHYGNPYARFFVDESKN